MGDSAAKLNKFMKFLCKKYEMDNILRSYIRGFASKLEAEKIRERTMRGKVAHLKEGKLPQGTGIGIYGYQWDKSTGRRAVVGSNQRRPN